MISSQGGNSKERKTFPRSNQKMLKDKEKKKKSAKLLGDLSADVRLRSFEVSKALEQSFTL